MELRPVFVRLCPPFYSHSNKYEFIFIWPLNIARSGHESNRMLIGCVYSLYVTRMRMNLVQEMEKNWNWIFFHRTSRFALNYSSLLLNFVFPFILAIRYEEIRVYFIFLFCRHKRKDSKKRINSSRRFFFMRDATKSKLINLFLF